MKNTVNFSLLSQFCGFQWVFNLFQQMNNFCMDRIVNECYYSLKNLYNTNTTMMRSYQDSLKLQQKRSKNHIKKGSTSSFGGLIAKGRKQFESQYKNTFVAKKKKKKKNNLLQNLQIQQQQKSQEISEIQKTPEKSSLKNIQIKSHKISWDKNVQGKKFQMLKNLESCKLTSTNLESCKQTSNIQFNNVVSGIQSNIQFNNIVSGIKSSNNKIQNQQLLHIQNQYQNVNNYSPQVVYLIPQSIVIPQQNNSNIVQLNTNTNILPIQNAQNVQVFQAQKDQNLNINTSILPIQSAQNVQVFAAQKDQKLYQNHVFYSNSDNFNWSEKITNELNFSQRGQKRKRTRAETIQKGKQQKTQQQYQQQQQQQIPEQQEEQQSQQQSQLQLQSQQEQQQQNVVLVNEDYLSSD
eukprot:TRINITY_DN12135_c0_g1_i5.p1 TRINITY_DN12135_c0_g1~~TRINITY_DN12135_c0_g1_i5.p1  ORF type:complete len:407 (-),score=31.98 TRINITY_DN12135_c0_g1_i5:500-1720(-)